MSVIGSNIRALREIHHLTQQELADIAGVTRETVNKWETGSIGNVRTSNLNVLRSHFNLTVDDLRSESAGLAARVQGRASFAPGQCCVPLLPGSESCEQDRPAFVEVPASVLAHHPNAFAMPIPDDSVSHVMPEGAHAVVDPDLSPASGSLVLAKVPGQEEPLVRRMHVGSTKVLLSPEGIAQQEDIVLDIDGWTVIGTVVWYQAPEELA